MYKPSGQEVLNAIDQGIRNAQRDYLKSFQSDISSSYAPEYLMTVYIYQSLLGLIDGYGLALEVPVGELFLTKLRGRKPWGAREGGRSDLVLWDSNDKPRVAIEVKKDAWNYYEDLIRLKRLLKRGLEFSVFASCWFEEVKDNNFKEAEDKLEEEIEFLRKYILDDNGKLGVNPSIELVHSNIDHLTIEGERSEDNEELVWRPVIFTIYSKENHE